MVRIITTTLFLLASTTTEAAIWSRRGDNSKAPISLDDIEDAKAARLMKNKEDIDVQSTYHEVDIQGTGEYSDDNSARLVKNRGPITAKITASGSHNRYCRPEDHGDSSCSVQFSLVAWKFAGDEGTVHGVLEEQYMDGTDGLKVDVDCMVRKDNEALVGGVVTEANSIRHPVGRGSGRRVYVKVVDDENGKGDYVSNVIFDDGINSHCKTPGMYEKLMSYEGDNNVKNARVGVCSKHGDWDGCLERAKVEQAIQ